MQIYANGGLIEISYADPSLNISDCNKHGSWRVRLISARYEL